MPGETITQLTEKTDAGLLKLTIAGEEVVAPYVTSVDESVYVFKHHTEFTPAAVMARFSRSPNGGREILAQEFLGEKLGRDEKLIQTVVTEFGDDSVAQLEFLQLVIEGASALSAKGVERGRLAAFLEQSSRYIRFDYKDENGNYRYVVPEELNEAQAKVFKEKTDAIFDIYTEIFPAVFEQVKRADTETPQDKRDDVWERSCRAAAFDAIRGILPMSTKANVGVSGSAQAIYNMILHLESDPLAENRKIGRQVLEAVRLVSPAFFERADRPDRGGLVSYNKETTRRNSRSLVERLIEKHGGVEQEPGYSVKLLGTYVDEEVLIAKIMTDHSDKPYEGVLDVVRLMSDEEKGEVIRTYVGDRDNRRVRPGRAFELPHYLLEVQCDIGAFRDIQRGRMVDGFDWQLFTTGLDHVRPSIIDAAGVADKYEQAFAISHELYDVLKEEGGDELAQYAALYGHNVRFTFMTNARSLIHTAELRTTPQGHESYRRVFQDIVAEIEKVHPHVTRVMTFLNKDEDKLLARQGALRAAHDKALYVEELKRRAQAVAK